MRAGWRAESTTQEVARTNVAYVRAVALTFLVASKRIQTLANVRRSDLYVLPLRATAAGRLLSPSCSTINQSTRMMSIASFYHISQRLTISLSVLDPCSIPLIDIEITDYELRAVIFASSKGCGTNMFRLAFVSEGNL